ncbi:uncharacterized protein BJ171DRAFT_496972 [Polychytrium aggregatum]|uniref:uncharacterized protein n=1 Tax=Polychytrium aggregatum TaxID=110093 RepID=UPI0022FE03C9|nr:uncharacterized protein BJ171DRAFT_496972 [Polychytrium aggregatum]KAI9206792.1 hypothetical protein BJ171DRAFT_496972 [Polychytrium aggregatum]
MRSLLLSKPFSTRIRLARTFSSTSPSALPQWILRADDETDSQALQRRLEARPAHLVRAAEAKKTGTVLLGGAIMSESRDRMVGSVMVLEFETREEAEEWVINDPYIKNRVWQRSFTLEPFRIPDNMK